MNRFRIKLVNDILMAATQEEVSELIHNAISQLEGRKVNGYHILRTVEKVDTEINSFIPLDKAPQQWSNIKMARIVLNRLRNKWNDPAKYPLPNQSNAV